MDKEKLCWYDIKCAPKQTFLFNIYTDNVIPLLLDTNMSKILIIYYIPEEVRYYH